MPTRFFLFSGLLVGTLDISAALIQYSIQTGKDPLNVLRFIASGVLGADAFAGGLPTAAFGLLLHFGIAFAFTAFFFWLYPRWTFLAQNWVLSGLLYGIFIWLVMNLLVLPLSRVPQGVFSLNKALVAVLILVCMIGLPLSWLATKKWPTRL
ncbi:MAG: hypothetical protein IT260_15470 [Saprospiraceae bacterium]|nr:hypothetical protein [Saprospiraceae bacterium]